MVVCNDFQHLVCRRDGLLLEPRRNLVTILAVGVVEVEDYLLVSVIAQLMRLSVFVFEVEVDGDIARQVLVGSLDFEGNDVPFPPRRNKANSSFLPERAGRLCRCAGATVGPRNNALSDSRIFSLAGSMCVSLPGEAGDASSGRWHVETGEDVDEVDEALLCHLLAFQHQGIGKVIVVPVVLAQIAGTLLHAAECIGEGRIGKRLLRLALCLAACAFVCACACSCACMSIQASNMNREKSLAFISDY